MEIRRILVGVDEANVAEHAIRAARDLADRLSAELEFVHAVPMEMPNWAVSGVPRWSAIRDEILDKARTSRREFLASLDEESGDAGADIALSVMPGKPARVLLERERQKSADLIVLGGHRRRGLLRFGSTSRTVLGKCSCPVWVQSSSLQPIRRILAPLDMSANSHLTMAWCLTLARVLDARVSALHCFVPPYFSYDDPPLDLCDAPTLGFEEFRKHAEIDFNRVVDEFDWGGLQVDRAFEDGTPSERILEHAGAGDLIVMGTHGRTGLSRAILGSQAYSVMKEASCPVLAVPNPSRSYSATPAGGHGPVTD